LRSVRVVVVLGKLAFDTYLFVLKEQGGIARRSEFSFGHGRKYQPGAGQPLLLCSYHPSQQNTSTGRLTARMLLDVMESARQEIEAA